MDFVEKIKRCHEYVEALEEERKKIQVFQRELPLCLELVTQAIEACKRELSGNSTTTDHYMHGHSECSEQTTSSNGRPVILEEFIPLKRANSSSHNDNGDDDHESNDEDGDEHQSHERNNNDQKQKSDWLRSVQLWNQSPDPPVDEDVSKKAEVNKNNGGAFQPFQKEKSSNGKTNSTAKDASNSVPATSSSENGGKGSKNGDGNGKKDEKEGQNQRKTRRCWSPELHRRFLHALGQLGGSHATPKQIRELMKVDGLTNDEVKSHLQKYRLHTRRPSPTIHNNNNAAAPQFLVVGGIWVPPPDYATMAATTGSADTATIAAANGIYAPVAAPLPTIPRKQHQQSYSKNLQSEGWSSHSEGGHRCGARSNSNSPATSSFTHTTNSPVF